MKRAVLLTTVLAFALLAMATVAIAQQPQVIHFQGLLVGPDGGPLQTDIYEVEFSIWEHATNEYEPLWSEIQMVETTNGLFDVFLGSVDVTLSADVFVDEDDDGTYLQVQVVGDEPMTPRIQMGKTPTSFISSRVLGDIQTGAGSLRMIDPYDDKVGFDVFIGGEGNSIKMMDPTDEKSLIEMSGGIGGEASFYMFNPQPEPPAVLMEMSSSPSLGGSFRMFNPQPEPPADPLLEMNTTEFGANFAMGAPGAGGLRNEITDPKFEVNVDSDGGSMDIYDEIGKYMGVEPVPFMPGGRFQMIDPIADAVKFEVETTEDGASISIYDEIGKVMGLEPMPFTPGGFLYFIDPAADDTNMFLGSDGYLRAKNGNFGDSNINSGVDAFVIGRNNSVSGNFSFAGGQDALANHSGCFVFGDGAASPSYGISSNASNQFLVRSTGGIAFFSNSELTYGVSLGPGDYSWNSILPPLTAHNSRDVNGSDILNKIEQLPIRQFTIEGENKQIKHISPVPEDFNRLFGVGEDDNHISMLDPSGVALAGVQALLDKIEKLEARIAELEAERR